MEKITENLSNGKTVVYKKLESGTCYHEETPKEVCRVLENLQNNRSRIRVWYGQGGVSWNEENDTIGYIGRSTGNIKIPLLVHNSRSIGGGALLDHCIVKIVDTKSGNTLYEHPKFTQANFTTKNNAVFIDGAPYAPHCKNNASAERLASFMNGNRHCK